jgi:hypothetical protein
LVERVEVAMLNRGRLRLQFVVDLTAQLPAHHPVTDECRQQDRYRNRRRGDVGDPATQ